MPRRMQILKMQDELKRQDISPDLVDLNALIDANLSYPENYKNIMSRYKRVDNKARKSKAALGSGGNIDIAYASQYHQSRSQQARQADEARAAKKTYTEKQISRKPDLLDAWYKNPGKSDIFGIDVFGYSKSAKRKGKKRK